MRKRTRTLIVLLITAIISTPLLSQTLEETLQSMAKDNARLYLEPFPTAFGVNMNSGLYHRAKPHKFLGFDVSIKVMAAQIPDEAKTFNFLLSENSIPIDLSSVGLSTIEMSFADIYAGSETETPTVFGKDDSTTFDPNYDNILTRIKAESGLDDTQWSAIESSVDNMIRSNIHPLTIPGGYNVDYFPLVMPQVSVGLPLGIEATARFVPTYNLGDYGDFNMLGIGGRINLDQFIPIPLFPVDITAGAFYQTMTIGDIITANNTSFHVEVGKTLSLLIFSASAYAGFGMESSNINVDYTMPANPDLGIESDTQISFDLEGANKSRFNAGISLTIVPLTYINVDLAMGEYTAATIGLGISLR